MALTPGTIKPAFGARTTVKRVGRGNGSQKGTSAARGTKGQRARSGGKKGTTKRTWKAQLLKVPKLRGFTSIVSGPTVITLGMLDRMFKDGDQVTPWTLEKKGAVSAPKRGVKIVATGTLSKQLTIKGCVASKTALVAIEKAGGTLSI